MIKKNRDLTRTSMFELRGGKGTVEMTHIIDESESAGTARLYCVATLPPGASIGYHKHEGTMEVYHILKGVAHIVDNDTPVVLEAGDSTICKDGDSHSIENKGTEDLVALFLVLYSR